MIISALIKQNGKGLNYLSTAEFLQNVTLYLSEQSRMCVGIPNCHQRLLKNGCPVVSKATHIDLRDIFKEGKIE